MSNYRRQDRPNENIPVLFALEALDALTAMQEKQPNSLSYIVNMCLLHCARQGYVPPSRPPKGPDRPPYRTQGPKITHRGGRRG